MRLGIRNLILGLAWLLVILLTGCIGFGDPLDAEDRQQIDAQIREAIEKTFPLPELVVIKTHVGDDLRFSTSLSVAEVAAFYREAYAAQDYVEGVDGQVEADRVVLLFSKPGEEDVALEASKTETGSDVHLRLQPPAP
jgi:hypothetical protein